MSRRTHRELAVGSHLISERQREKQTKAERNKEKEKTSEVETKALHPVASATTPGGAANVILPWPCWVLSEPPVLLLAHLGTSPPYAHWVSRPV